MAVLIMMAIVGCEGNVVHAGFCFENAAYAFDESPAVIW